MTRSTVESRTQGRQSRPPYACLAMYPFAELRPAWEQLWAAVHELAPWTPPALTWPVDVHDSWTDSACCATQACGWPVATSLRDRVTIIGAFELDINGAEGHRYRSVLVATRDEPPQSFAARRATAALNGEDSLSGWISLLAGTGATGRRWPGSIVATGAHIDSLRAVQAGAAELASIDPLTWTYLSRLRPQLTEGLHVVGRGPLVPSPPVVAPAMTPADRSEELRRALANATKVAGIARAELSLTGFAAVDPGEYFALPELLAAG